MGFRENLKSELEYSGMLVKELAARSGVKKKTIDSYLGVHSYTPSVEAAVRIAGALGVSAEYLVMGKESKKNGKQSTLSPDMRQLVRSLENLNEKKRTIILKNAIHLADALR